MHASPTRRQVLATLGALALPAAAQGYPNRPLTLVVPFPAGGPNDITARLVGEELGRRLGQTVVVDNRPGAAGNIGAVSAARSAPDGHTLFLAQAATHGINPSIYKRVGYDPVRDFAPVALLASVPLVLLTRPGGKLRTLADLIAQAKAAPDTLTYGSGGNGSSLHVAGELLKSMAGVDIRHVPYKSVPAAITDTISGNIDIVIDALQSASRFIKSGQLWPLAVGARTRLPGLPDVPAVAELLPGYEATSWTGLVVPAATPGEVVARLNREVNEVLRTPAVRERFAELFLTPTGGSPEAMDQFVRAELAKWKRVAAERNITAD